MSKKMGPLAYGKGDTQPFLGKEMSHNKDYSETTAIEIDNEVKQFVMDGYNRATRILQDNLDLLHRVSQLLLEKETIDGKEIEAIMEELGSQIEEPRTA
jgi:cell division protease FtsH